MTVTNVQPDALHWLRHERKWSRGEKQILLVLLAGAPQLSVAAIEHAPGVRHTRTVHIVLDALEGAGVAGHTPMGYYYLTALGRAFALQIVGLA